MKKIAMIAAAVLACGAAQAQTNASPIYGEVGYSMLNADVAGVDLDFGMIRGILGYEIHPNVAIEAMLGLGTSDDSVSFEGETLKLKVQRTYGLYVKPKVEVAEGLELFGRIGFAESKVKATVVGYGSASDSDNDFSFGAGVKYTFSKNVYGVLDYMRYYNKDDIKVDGFTFGVGYKF
ncbi:porin family protein [Rubrivivax benzoatilyticus]|uniref:Porin family protein n=3 Tax=Rubrivivax TaxID=28067 RepID=A0ABX0HZK4_9BURK|nr:hypothetical protein RBXJA2T_09802 [Rubrivivax benzoatilyticus JA2 = ATCC BAA-35]NHK99026.1 porin family protein [Rubrivivax benzoatilyticus]NHL25111.1 porin family protein [Rubrivivax benzoatilyticus]